MGDSLYDWYNAPASSRNTNGTVSSPSSSGSSGSINQPGMATGGGSGTSSPGYVTPRTAGGSTTSADYAKMLQDALAKQRAELQAQQAQQQSQQQAQQQAAQKSADDARIAAEQAAAAKKQGYINTQTGLYNDYFTNQQNSQLSALRNARDTAQQGYNSSERVAQQTAYNNSNQVDAQHTQSAQRMKEIMAANGLLSSGDNITQNLQLENQRQGALYDINQSKGNVLQNVAEQRSLLNNQAASQEQGLANQISADKSKALIDLQQYGDQKETDLTKFNYGTYSDALNRATQQGQNDIQNRLAEANLTGQYNGNQTLAAANSARQDALARAGLSGTLDGQQTLAARGQAFDQSMGIADRTGQMGNGTKTLAAQALDRQNKNDNISLAQWITQTYGTNAAPKSDAGVAFDQANGIQPLDTQKFEWGKQVEKEKMQQSAEQYAKSLGLDYEKLSAQRQQSIMQAANQNASLGIQRDKLSWDKDPMNVDNRYKESEINWKESQANKNNSSPMTSKQFESESVTNLKNMTAEMRKRFFSDEEGTIVKNIGVAGYNRLYGQYFDAYGIPK